MQCAKVQHYTAIKNLVKLDTQNKRFQQMRLMTKAVQRLRAVRCSRVNKNATKTLSYLRLCICA